jgi:hypothetical protein
MSKEALISEIQEKVRQNRNLILKGYMLVIDPSIGSSSSLPGFAVYRNGKLTESGVLKMNIGASKHKRLHELVSILQKEFEVPDILGMELIAGPAFGVMRWNINAFHSLIRSTGAIMAAYPVETVIEVPPSVWKKTIDDDYVKSDEMDAIYIGRYLILSAKGELPNVEEKPTKQYRPSKKKAVTVRPRKPRKSKAGQ